MLLGSKGLILKKYTMKMLILLKLILKKINVLEIFSIITWSLINNN